jgi:acetyltransferase-like isoleucine patch superfamily enzyme
MGRMTQHHCTYRRKQYGFDQNDDRSFFRWRKARKVQVDADVWIGTGAIVVPGERIGIGAVVGAGAVVTKDVAPYTIVVGVPAKPIKKRFSDKVIKKLVSTRWWEWDHDTLKLRFNDLFEVEALY